MSGSGLLAWPFRPTRSTCSWGPRPTTGSCAWSGCRVGRGALVLARPPVCTDLVSIGAGAVIRQDAIFPGYFAQHGWLYPGRITIGDHASVGDAAVLDVDASIDDDGELGNCSALHEGQRVPAGETWFGSPAEPSTTSFQRVEPVALRCGRRARFTASQLLSMCLFSLPSTLLPVYAAAQFGLSFDAIGSSGGVAAGALGLVVIGGLVYFGGLVWSAAIVVVVPRVANRFSRPEHTQPLYGFQYQLAHTIARVSNNHLLTTVFGDSSMIVGWMSAVGYDLRRTTQTGSNFGVDQRHHSPFLCSFDRNTLVSDGLRLLNMEVSSTSFVMRRIAMPPDTYVGNVVHYPAGAQVGAELPHRHQGRRPDRRPATDATSAFSARRRSRFPGRWPAI